MHATYNMKDLSNDVADKFSLTNKQGAELTQYVFDKIKEEVVSGRQVRLHKFGTLEARKRAAGVARNPTTGAKVVVPARRVVKLTVSPHLREMLDTGAAPAASAVEAGEDI